MSKLSIFQEEEEYKPPSLFDDEYVEEDIVEDKAEDGDEVDPLDAFMNNIGQEIEQDKNRKRKPRPDLDQLCSEDPMEVYLEGIQNDKRLKALEEREQQEMEKAEQKSAEFHNDEQDKFVPMVPPIDFGQVSSLEIPPFKKRFYSAHSDVENMTSSQIDTIRKEMQISVSGKNIPAPCTSFGYFGLDERIMDVISSSGFTVPTPIQAQALPAALSGNDILGLARTGSGKTFAYLWPVLTQISDRIGSNRSSHEPLGLIMAPTRELADQIYKEARKFTKSLEISVAPVYGGRNLHEQVLMLQGHKHKVPQCDLIVCTPGRMIDHLSKSVVSLVNVSIVVLDECDRMLQMGFEPQVRSVLGQIRPDSQKLMFSATFAEQLSALVETFMDSPIQIQIGDIGSSNRDVIQELVLVKSDDDKWAWLKPRIKVYISKGPVLIFAATKAGCQDLGNKLASMRLKVGVVHGDKLQHDRHRVLEEFRNGEISCVVCTDVAARGLDITGLEIVINYDIARDVDSHVHRIGRTGRAGRIGTAYTLISKQNPGKVLPMLVENVLAAGHSVAPAILKLSGMVSAAPNSQ